MQPEEPWLERLKRGRRNILIGGLWFLGGTAVTGFSYYAVRNGGGGSYIVAIGAVAIGGLQLLAGVLEYFSARRHLNHPSTPDLPIGAVVVACLLAIPILARVLLTNTQPDSASAARERSPATQEMVDAIAAAKARIPNERAASFAGKWCWMAPAESARTKGGPPAETFNLDLRQLGARIEGTHCRVAQWGDRIDCADAKEITVTGTAVEHAELAYRSAYDGSSGTAQLTLIPGGVRWIPKGAGAGYLPDRPTDLIPCK